MDSGQVVIIGFKVSIEFIVFWIVKECYPLCVLLVLDHVLMQEVSSQLQADGAEELVVVLVLHNDAHDFLRFGILERDHHNVGVC